MSNNSSSLLKQEREGIKDAPVIGHWIQQEATRTRST